MRKIWHKSWNTDILIKQSSTSVSQNGKSKVGKPRYTTKFQVKIKILNESNQKSVNRTWQIKMLILWQCGALYFSTQKKEIPTEIRTWNPDSKKIHIIKNPDRGPKSDRSEFFIRSGISYLSLLFKYAKTWKCDKWP